jgi:hypothetical protein
MTKQLAKFKINKLVNQYAKITKDNFGIDVDVTTHFKRIYADYQAGLITLQDIEAETIAIDN